jgi:ABC-2 type transport system ATP-binding protein
MILIGHGRIVAQGDKKSLLSRGEGAATSLVMSLDNAALAAALTSAGHQVEAAGEGLKVHAATEEVGRAAIATGVVLTDLRSGGAGLEDLFLELTSTTQRDAVPASHAPPHQHMPDVAPMPPVDTPSTGGPHA